MSFDIKTGARRSVLYVLAFLLGLAAGAMMYRLANPLYAFRSSLPLKLKHDTGLTAVLPAGSLFLSPERPRATWDIGWWGCVPVGFPSEAEAIEFGLEPAEDVLLIDYFDYSVEPP